MRTRKKTLRKERRASSLVITLLVIVVLSTIVVAFMQSMSVERMTAKSYKDSFQAQLAAEAGVNSAKSQLVTLFDKYPDSATVWSALPAGLTTEGTVFYFKGKPLAAASLSAANLPVTTNGAAYNPNATLQTAVQMYAWPLISGASPVIATSLANTFTNQIVATNSINLNTNNWIGTAPGQPKKAIWAQWIYLTDSAGVPYARYAYWVDDESFKVNVSQAGNTVRGSTSLGTNNQEIPLQGVLTNLAGGEPGGDSAAQSIVTLRNKFGSELPSFGTVSQAFTNLSGTNAMAEQLKFIATTYSSGLNLSRGGWKRVNINNIFTNTLDPLLVRAELDRFITTVTNNNAAPLFGQRFYRSSVTSSNALSTTTTVPAADAQIYLQKIAANVKDYIDSDSQPTIINSDFTVRSNTPVTAALEPAGGGTSGANPVIAIGKEIVPMLQEYARHVRLLSMSPAGWSNHNPGAPGASYKISIDHYFEFWNMGTKDIVVSGTDPSTVTLGNDAVLTVYNEPQLGADGLVVPVIPESRVETINLKDIPNLRFKAGQATIITTDPNPNATLIAASGTGINIFSGTLAVGNRIFVGTTTDVSSVGASDGTTSFNNAYRVLEQPRSNSQNDYEACMFIGNGSGLIESFCSLPIVGSAVVSIFEKTPAYLNSDLYWVRGGSLHGNSGGTVGLPVSASGDPRSLNEQMQFITYDSADTDLDQTRFYSSGFVDGSAVNSSSIGALDVNYTVPTLWPDYAVNSSGAANAPMIIANTNMATIGEFGNIYDPSRIAGSAAVSYSRGGGRTFHIGQSETWSSSTNVSGLWDGRWDSASRTWAAWRLADFFDTGTNTVLPGLININGARRDNGVAIKAALDGFIYQAAGSSDPSLSGVAPNQTQLGNLVAAVTNRLNGTNGAIPGAAVPFWERGELSELPLFQGGTTLNGVEMKTVLDRGREELVRRMLNLVTTKGNTYSVYAVGQAIYVSGTTIKVLASSRMKQTFQLNSDDISSQVDTFDPSAPSEVTTRFNPITNFTAKPLWNSQE